MPTRWTSNGILGALTEPAPGTDPVLDAAWRGSSAVALRPEPFGAMAYHFGTRRLSFLKSARLAEVVARLGDHPTARAACAAAGVPENELAAYAGALGRLAGSGMVERRACRDPGWAGGKAAAPTGGAPRAASSSLKDRFEHGLDAPICLTWELTYGCNLACAHCLSDSGRRHPDELTTAQCTALIDELASLRVFYVNIGGGEPTIRRDFWELVGYAVDRRVGVKFSTNGTRMTRAAAAELARSDYVDVQISIDGATAEVNDAVRGEGSFAAAVRAMAYLAEAGCQGFKVSVVVTRHNVDQLDALEALAGSFGAQLRITRLRPSGRGAAVWDELHPTAFQQRRLYDWLRERGERVLTGDSFFHLAGYGEPLPGLNLCGAGRVVCLVDPVGDVYACPFTIHDDFRAGNVRGAGGLTRIWRESELFGRLRRSSAAGPDHPDTGPCASCSAFGSCRGGCMAAKYFTGMPLGGPDPECVRGHGRPVRVSLRERRRTLAVHHVAEPARGPDPRLLGQGGDPSPAVRRG